MNQDIRNYHLLCGINAPRHLANLITTKELNEIMAAKEQKIFLKPRVDDPKVLTINETIVGALEATCQMTKYGNSAIVF
jgi:hypothetical protein